MNDQTQKGLTWLPEDFTPLDLYSHSVLMLSNAEPGRGWVLNIQQLPVPAVTLRGVDPTAEEVTRALMHTNAPIWMIPLCMVLAATATRLPARADAA